MLPPVPLYVQPYRILKGITINRKGMKEKLSCNAGEEANKEGRCQRPHMTPKVDPGEQKAQARLEGRERDAAPPKLLENPRQQAGRHG
jgi:hypothetical protein